MEDAPISTTDTVIKDVTVVDTRSGSLRKNMDILVSSGRILTVGASGTVQPAGTPHTVRAPGKYVVPGYLDMHAHALYSHALTSMDREQGFKLLIANGVTGFREMSGSKELVALARRLRDEIDAGTTVAPEPLIIPGEVVNIFPGMMLPMFEGSAGTATDPAEMGRREVMRQKEYGAEFIKIVNVNREAFFAIQDTAREVGLHVAGHLNPVVSAREASKAGLRAIEHLGPVLAVLLDCSFAEGPMRSRTTAPRPLLPAGPPSQETIRRIVANPAMLMWSRKGAAMGLKLAIRTFSTRKARALAKVFVEHGTWQVPTLIRVRTMQIFDDPRYREDPNLRYVAPDTRAMWQDLADEFGREAPGAVKRAFRKLYDVQLELTGLLKEEGVKMLAGSDMTGGWCIAGFSLHQEFDELARAGFSPLEVLRMTTLGGAEFLGREATLGTVEEGKNADLVLLDANPLESVRNLGKVHAVVLRGRYLPKGELEKMKSDVAGYYAEKRA